MPENGRLPELGNIFMLKRMVWGVSPQPQMGTPRYAGEL